MTLIAIATYGQRAEMVTDSISYAPGLASLGRTFKMLPMPLIDAVTATQGDSTFGALWDVAASGLEGQAFDFDDFLAHAPAHIKDAWSAADTRTDSMVFLVGYSAARGRFVAYGYASETSFEAFEIKGLFVHPSPFDARPSDVEIGRAERVGCHADDVAYLRSLPKPMKPANADEWAALAVKTRQHRAFAPMKSRLKVLVAGQVHHTVVTRGWVATTRLLEFDDSGEEFQRLIAGSLHPQAQLGPCECGSGRRFLDCCLVQHLDEDCLCKSGKPTRDCCSVAASDGQPASA